MSTTVEKSLFLGSRRIMFMFILNRKIPEVNERCAWRVSHDPLSTSNMADADSQRCVSALLNGITQRLYYGNTEITEEFLKNELYAESTQDEFRALHDKMRSLLKVSIHSLHEFYMIAETFIDISAAKYKLKHFIENFHCLKLNAGVDCTVCPPLESSRFLAAPMLVCQVVRCHLLNVCIIP